ncbi:4Fe-4S dicluster domain-containing protein [Bacteroidota bacterium]
MGIAGISSVPTKAVPPNKMERKGMGVLVDTTICIGCRNCEWACKDAHNLKIDPQSTYNDRTVLKKNRRPDEYALTVVNEYNNPGNQLLPTDVKVQCMHCDHPACASACIVGAFTKQENGAVTWDSNKCIGCRYCMIACPFQVPAFEYSKALEPNIMKCDFCFERTKQGQLPACVEICPTETLTYGKRDALINIAQDRIKRHPDRYVNHILGEYEVGGTSWMYLAGQDFAKLDFPILGNDPAPGVTESIQHGIFAYFIPPIALYALLGGVMWLNKNKNKSEDDL